MTKAEQIKKSITNMSVYQLGEFLLLWPDFMKNQGIDSREKVEAWLNSEVENSLSTNMEDYNKLKQLIANKYGDLDNARGCNVNGQWLSVAAIVELIDKAAKE